MRIWLLLLFVFVLLCEGISRIPAPSQETSLSPAVRQFISEGHALLEHGEKDLARRSFLAAQRLAPKSVEVKQALDAVVIKGVLDVKVNDQAFEVVVFVGDTAENTVNQFFRKNQLPMEEGVYLALYNSVNAMIRGEPVPVDEELQVSKVVKSQTQTQTHRHHHHHRHQQQQQQLLANRILTVVDASLLSVPNDVPVYVGEAALGVVNRIQQEHPSLSVDKLILEAKIARIMISALNRRVERLQHVVGPFIHPSQWFPQGPDVDLVKPLSHQDNNEEWAWDNDVSKAQSLIYENQFPADCSSRKALVFHFDRSYFGLAVNVHFLTVALAFGIKHNRTVVTRSPDHWNYAGSTCSAGWECYFRSISHCRESDFWEPYTTDVRQDYTKDFRGYIYHVNTLDARVLHYANVDGVWQQVMHAPALREFIPPQLSHKSLLWWRSQLSRFVFRPKSFVMDFINERVNEIKYSTVGVGLHVRHGDKSFDVMHQASYFGGLTKYIELAKLQSNEHAQSFFLSSDDPAVIEEAQMLQQSTNLQFLWDNDEERYNGTHVYAPIGVSLSRWPGFPGNDVAVNTTRYALDSIKSIWLLMKMDYFVGTVTSCFSRLVYQLRVAKGTSREDESNWSVDFDPRFGHGWFVDP